MNQGILAQPTVLERERLVELVRKWADVNSDGVLEEDCEIFTVPEIEGFIAYKQDAQNAVVFGDPITSPEDKGELAHKFNAFCHSKGWGTVYTIVSESFATWGKENLAAVMIEFGTNFTWDPHNDPTKSTGSKAVLVRKKVKNALSNGTTVEEYHGDNPEIEKEIEDVAESWVKKRKGPQVFLSHVTLFKNRTGKRWFYAKKDNKIVGFLILNELKVRQGWLLNNVMMVEDAPKGLSELLVVSTLQILDKENCRFVIAGPVPAKQLGKIEGLGDIGSGVMRFLFKSAKVIFQLDGRATFWEKFQPEQEGSYLLFPNKNVGFSSVKALLKAFNVGKG